MVSYARVPDDICLVIPCFNEAARLDMAAFRAGAASSGLTLVFVDDGSTDGTAALIEPHVGERIRLIRLERNRGKGEAVRQGILQTAATPLFDRLAWIGFWDADLSTPLSEVPRFLDYLAFSGRTADAVIGSRVALLGSRIQRRVIRHVTGRTFATAAALLLGIRAYDSQCGAKLLRPAAARAAFADPFLSRWLFDVEILLRIGEDAVVEYPLRQWTHKDGSKLRLLPHVWRTARDLMRLRRHYGRR